MSDFEIDGIAVNKMRVVDLKNALDERGLSKAGRKDELVARLIEFMEGESSEGAKETPEEPELNLGDKGKVDVVGKSDQDIQQQELEKEKEADRKLAEEIAAKQRAEEEEKQKAALELKRKLEEDQFKAKKEKEEEEKARAEKERQAEEERLKTLERQKQEEKERFEQLEKKKQEEEAAANKEEEERLRVKAERLEKEKERAAEEKLKAEKIREEEMARKERKSEMANDNKEDIEAQKKADREDMDKQSAMKEQDKDQTNSHSKSVDKEQQLKIEQEKIEEEKKKLEEEEELVRAEKEKLEKERKAREKKDSDESSALKMKDNVPSENNGDDTLVMEVDQHDMVPDEPSKDEEKIISAEPGEVTSFRKLGGSKSSESERGKRGWGASRSNRNQSSEDVEISSNSLKDLVPDLKPLMSVEAKMEDDEEEVQTIDSDADVAGPKIPEKVKNESGEPVRKRKKIVLDDNEETNFILIINLTRPFTVNQLKEMLKRTGTIEDFWIDRIKSKCCVKFSSKDQASETKMALDGVTWPQGSPKTLRVSFSTEKDMDNFKEGANDGSSRLTDLGGRNGGIREWDRVKLEQEKERQKDRERERVRRDSREKERDEKENRESEEKKVNTKCLEDLFKKTSAIPAIYWKSVTEEERKKKEEEKNKKAVEAQILKDMMDTKESLQRSKRLVPERRRSRSSSGSSR